MKWNSRAALSLALLALAACGDRTGTEDPADTLDPPDGEDTLYEPSNPAATGPDSVSVFFTRDEEPVEVRRVVTAGAPDIRAALERLLEGPTPAEQEQGIRSWFDGSTAGMLRAVTASDGSHVVVDFADLRAVIPNASTSTGSALLLKELNTTVFQFPEIHSVEYRMDGSCELFWEWLQYECQTVTRPAL